MSDQFTTVEYQGWFSRLKDAFFGVLFGVILFICAPILLFWNEGRAVATAKGLAEGKGAVVDAKADPVDAGNENKLVHISGKAAPTEPLKDSEFGITTTAIRLQRHAEMYQWKEKKETEERKTLGGGKEKITRYTYTKDWSSNIANSDSFKEREGHENPKQMAFSSATTNASKVTLGAFTLATSQVTQLSDFKPFTITAEMLKDMPAEIQEKVKLEKGGLYAGANPAAPAVGDTRVNFETVPAGEISIVAQQVGSSFQPFQTKAGTTLDMVRSGTMTAQAMFAAEESENAIITWLVRLAGFVIWWISLCLIAGPLSTVADVIPFFGSIIGAGVGFFGFMMAGALSFLTIGIAWVAFRPLLGGAMIAGTVALIVMAKGMGKKKG